MKILEFHPTKTQIERAKIAAGEFRVNENSIMNGERNLFAFLAEEVAGDFLKKSGWNLHPKDRPVWDFDIIDPNGNKWDIKSKMTTVKPKSHFNCTVYSYREQDCDGYIFTRVTKNLDKVWLLGWISKLDLKKYGKLFRPGETDHGMKIIQECLGIQVRKLNPFKV